MTRASEPPVFQLTSADLWHLLHELLVSRHDIAHLDRRGHRHATTTDCPATRDNVGCPF